DTVDVDGHQARAEPFSLLAETVHQLGPLDPVGETRIVLYFGRDHQLATSREALEDDGLEVGAGCIQRGCQAGRAAADDGHLLSCGHWCSILAPLTPQQRPRDEK